MKSIFYSGVGSRDTPLDILNEMELIAESLCERGLILRSGGAKGADSAFEIGASKIDSSKKEIFLPWKSFNNNKSSLYIQENYDFLDLKANIARRFHHKFNNLNDAAKRLICRNSQIVLGKNCEEYSKFLICYCEKNSNGIYVGGTSQCIRIANYFKIKVFNFANAENKKIVYEDILNFLKKG